MEVGGKGETMVGDIRAACPGDIAAINRIARAAYALYVPRIGRALIAHVEAMALAAGTRAVELYTNVNMTENQTLYPRLGYSEISRGVEDGFERVFYRKALPVRKPRIAC